MGTGSKYPASQVLGNPSSLTFTKKVLDWIPAELCSGSHLIRGVGHSNSTLMPSGWLCPALLSFLSIHNGEPPSSNPNLLTPMTPSPQHTIGPVQPLCPQSHFIMQWGRSGADQNSHHAARSCLHNKVQGAIDTMQPHPSSNLSLTLQ